MKLLITAAIALSAIVSLNIVATNRDAEVMRAASLYEQCVQTEYHMSPSRWYEEHHKYPVCGN